MAGCDEDVKTLVAQRDQIVSENGWKYTVPTTLYSDEHSVVTNWSVIRFLYTSSGLKWRAVASAGIICCRPVELVHM